MLNKKLLTPFLIFVTLLSTNAQDSFRVMSYNILNYPSKISSARNPYFKKVIAEANPDILVVQEMESLSGVSLFSEEVLDTNYTAGGFINGNDTDNALFFKHSKFEFISNIPIKTQLRDISQLTLVYKTTLDTLLIFSAHLKASSGTDNEQKRLAEVERLRTVTDGLGQNKYFMVVGDFNFYKGIEPGFQALINQTESGYFLDPINKIGSWHNSFGYKGVHTQSTRTSNLSDEGSTGGLDDRFDFILVSQSIMDSSGIMYIEGSYTTLGNDNNHLNKALNEFPNSAVSNEIALALYNSSDHLPIYADFSIDNLTEVKNSNQNAINNNFELYQNYPNPFNPVTIISYKVPTRSNPYDNFVRLIVYNSMGEEVRRLVDTRQSSGSYEVNFDAGNLSSGIYFYSLFIDGTNLTKKMLLLK